MTDKLPPNLAALFAPRPPLRYLIQPDHPPEERRTARIDGLAKYLPALKEYKETDVYVPSESWLDRRDRKKQENKEAVEFLAESGLKLFKPHEDPNIRGDPFKTLFVGRLSYDAKEEDLEKMFGGFGPIGRIRIVTDTHHHLHPNKKKKPHRGYAFVEFEREKDMKVALESCDGTRLKDRRLKVDVERGRTVKGWKPRRLGGGLGGRHYTKALPSRPMGPGGLGGGFRGGFRGGGFEGRRGGGGGFRGGGGGFGGRGGGGGGFRGGDRGPNGFGGAPNNAPSGPGGGRGHDHGFGGRSFNDRHGGGGGHGGRFGDFGGASGSNSEPIGTRDRRRDGPRESRDQDDHRDRERGYREHRGDRDREDRDRGGRGGRDRDGRSNGGYRDHDRDHDRARDDDSRKRSYDGDDRDARKHRRY